MSINPVPAVSNATNASLTGGAGRSSSAPGPHEPSPRPNSGAKSIQEIQQRLQTSETLEIPRDEVQVQRDSASNGQIVIRYLDHSGQVILQVPSSQVLG